MGHRQGARVSLIEIDRVVHLITGVGLPKKRSINVLVLAGRIVILKVVLGQDENDDGGVVVLRIALALNFPGRDGSDDVGCGVSVELDFDFETIVRLGILEQQIELVLVFHL